MQIQLRPYHKQDFQPLEKIIRETWHYDQFCGPKAAARLARVFLSSCLTNYTFSRVAVIDGKVEGIILARNNSTHRCPLPARLRQIRALLSLYLSKDGRAAMQIFGNVNGIDKELLSGCGKTYPAELSLFAVSPACRRKGAGKKLFRSALHYMRQEGLKEFYLFTDTTCNYGFYEHQGMTRRCEKEHIFYVGGQRSKMNFFIYDLTL